MNIHAETIIKSKIKGTDKGFLVGARVAEYLTGISFIFFAYLISISGNKEPPKPQLLQT